MVISYLYSLNYYYFFKIQNYFPSGNSAAVVSDQLEMPKDKVGITIGAKGVVIQEIMRRSCCKIIIDQDVPEGI